MRVTRIQKKKTPSKKRSVQAQASFVGCAQQLWDGKTDESDHISCMRDLVLVMLIHIFFLEFIKSIVVFFFHFPPLLSRHASYLSFLQSHSVSTKSLERWRRFTQYNNDNAIRSRLIFTYMVNNIREPTDWLARRSLRLLQLNQQKFVSTFHSFGLRASGDWEVDITWRVRVGAKQRERKIIGKIVNKSIDLTIDEIYWGISINQLDELKFFALDMWVTLNGRASQPVRVAWKWHKKFSNILLPPSFSWQFWQCLRTAANSNFNLLAKKLFLASTFQYFLTFVRYDMDTLVGEIHP